jgi:PEGA domain
LKASPTRSTFDPRVVLPLDLLDPALPSSQEVNQKKKQERTRRTRTGLMIGGGVAGGLLVGAVVMFALGKSAPKRVVPDLNVSLEVQSDPPGAAIFVDGKSTGLNTPSQLNDWEFSIDHEIALELSGYYREHRKVAAGLHPVDLHVVLPRVAHLTAASQPVPATVSLDGEGIGSTPLDVDLPAEHEVKVLLRAPGFVPVARSLKLAPDETMDLNVTLNPLAIVRVKSVPPGAKVSIDGAPALPTPAEISVVAGTPHRLEARVPGLPSQTRALKVQAGKTELVELRFEDPRDRKARAELSRLRARAVTLQHKLARTEQRGGNEYIGTAHRLNDENAIDDDLERIEAREQDLEDEIANHDQELEDRIKAENIEASAAPDEGDSAKSPRPR